DMEGEEGEYYLWTYEEFEEALGTEDTRTVASYYDVSIGGNFEGKNILHTSKDLDVIAALARVREEDVLATVERARPVLLAARQRRIPPGRDDKVITSWNGLALQAFAEAAAVLGEARYFGAARDVATLLTTVLRAGGQLQHVLSGEVPRIPAFLDDFANLSFGLMLLYEGTFERQWLTLAAKLVEEALERFSDEDQARFYDTASEHHSPLQRSREFTDSAIPSGTSVFIDTLLHLAALLRRPVWEERAGAALERLTRLVTQYPSASGRLLCALDFHLRMPKEIAIAGNPEDETTRALLRTVRKHYLPNYVLACGEPDETDEPRLLQGRPMVRNAPTAYVCEHFVCLAPATSPEELAEALTASNSDVWREA
ncbi:MAG: thioredoxin domain-containing protein, partial [Chloroflexi bacterium]|nr:thioredoxin domain-containing protein [Chloroflexota bacterium]